MKLCPPASCRVPIYVLDGESSMNKPLERPEIVKDSIPVDQQLLLVALAENAALSGFLTYEYLVSIDQ